MSALPAWTETNGRRRPVVVGYNGTRAGRRAVSWAATEAQRAGSRLVVVYAADHPGMKTRIPGEGLLTLAPGALETAVALTDEGVELARRAHPSLLVSGRTEVASPADALVATSQEAALVVVGTRGLPRLVSAVIGSAAYAVAAKSTCPVVVVKDDGEATPPAGPDRPVLVGSDGSPTAATALAFAADYAEAVSAPLDVVCATNQDFSATVPVDELKEERAARAARIAEELARTHPSIAAVVSTPSGPAHEELIRGSKTAGLVVVGSRGHGALGGLVLGSVSQAVIHGSTAPVAVISAAAVPEAPDRSIDVR